MKNSFIRRLADIKSITLVIPVVLALIFGFLVLTENVILSLSKDRMALRSNNCVDDVNVWVERTLSELEIYKMVLDREGAVSEHAREVLSTSYGPHDEYPFGLYWGDEYRNFYDASGWDPGPQYVPAERDWYIEGLEHDRFVFGEPYVDVRTGRPCVSATVRLGYNDVTSVLAADVYFDYIERHAENITAQEIENAFFVTEKSRMIIADSDQEWNGKRLDSDVPSLLYRNISALLDEDFLGMTTVQGDGIYFVNIQKIDEIDWYFVTCMKRDVMLADLRRVDIYIYIIGLVACIVLILLTGKASREMSVMIRKARIDPLTKILNRDGFRSAVRTALKDNPGQGLLLMFDIDNFKMVNDQLGHPEGDEFLKAFSLLLGDYFNRNRDISARIGGDEFAVFVGRKMLPEDAEVMLGKFIQLFHGTFDERYAGQKLSVSIGAAFADKIGCSTLNEIYQNADVALYSAKNGGKDRYVFYG